VLNGSLARLAAGRTSDRRADIVKLATILRCVMKDEELDKRENLDFEKIILSHFRPRPLCRLRPTRADKRPGFIPAAQRQEERKKPLSYPLSISLSHNSYRTMLSPLARRAVQPASLVARSFHSSPASRLAMPVTSAPTSTYSKEKQKNGKYLVTLIPGDGIGPEVRKERVICDTS
jgi:hypothetical protein